MARMSTCWCAARATIGIDLGPNLSVTGSLATILWLTAIRREGEQVSAWTFLRLGAVVMPVALLLAMASLFSCLTEPRPLTHRRACAVAEDSTACARRHTSSTVNPNSRMLTSPGAERRSGRRRARRRGRRRSAASPASRPLRPPAARGPTGGSTLSRYSRGCASNNSQLGIDTQRTAMPVFAQASRRVDDQVRLPIRWR